MGALRFFSSDATAALAVIMNSSISRCAALRRRATISAVAPVSSSRISGSGRSKSIAPRSVRRRARRAASSAATSSIGTTSARAARASGSRSSTIFATSLYVSRARLRMNPSWYLARFAFPRRSKSIDTPCVRRISSGRSEQRSFDSRSGSIGTQRSGK